MKTFHYTLCRREAAEWIIMKKYTPTDFMIAGYGNVYRNLSVSVLTEISVKRGEGVLTDKGALSVKTGKYTGRSPNDKFIVDTPEVHDEINWGDINRPIAPELFAKIKSEMLAYLQNRDLFVFDGFAGADPSCTQRFRVINEFAFQNLFIRQLLIRPSEEQLESFEPDYTIIAAPGFSCVPETDGVNSEAAIIIDFSSRTVLIAGTMYCGEIKKSVFTVMNYVLPKRGVLPMHCSANTDDSGNCTVFFGLSGTGKTTLSSDPTRILVGDDEHGWSDSGVFNIEGGCYAKCIGLSEEQEPDIFNAAVDEPAAIDALDSFAEKWDGKYPKIAQSWRDNWPNLSTYFKYPEEVRRLIYTTNAIEGFNRQLRKVTKAKSVFPTDDSLFKMLYLAMMDITKKWTGRRQDWSRIHAQLAVYFAERMPD